MNILEEAIVFATKAHKGQKRKLSGSPYILHPLEVASIIATMTDDLSVMAAGVLHDTVEDCGISPDEIRNSFGDAVAALVASETENKRVELPPESTWCERKEESLKVLKNADDINVKIVWLADKLSNIRSFYREYQKIGKAVWQNLHQKDHDKQGWYYKKVLECITELSDTAAYNEYKELVARIFD